MSKSDLLKTAQKLDDQIAGARTELEQLNTQAAVLRNRLSAQLKGIDEEAQYRRESLEKLFKTRKREMDTAISGLLSQQEVARRELTAVTKAVIEANAELEAVRQAIVEAKRDVSVAEKQSVALQRETEERKQEVTRLESQKSVVEGELNALQDGITDAERRKQDVLQELEAIETKSTTDATIFEGQKEQRMKQLLDLDNQIARKLKMLKEVSTKDAVMRKELSDMRKDIERREEVVSRRERSVEAGENKLSSRLNMLQL